MGTHSQNTMSTNAFAHEALFYAGTEEFLSATLPFVQEGVTAGEPVLVFVSAEKIEHVRDQLNGEGERVLFADMDDVGANPARIIPAWRRFLDEHGSAGTAVRGIGEPISAGRPPDELVEWQRHESLLNLAFADVPAFRLLCPYDTAVLDDHVIEEARRSHPYVLARGVRRASPSFLGLDAIETAFAEPLPAPPASVPVIDFDASSLSALRDVVTARAAEAGLDDRRTGDLVLAVNEVATNSVRHGGGSGTLRIWVGTRWLVCDVEDGGRIDDPLAGRQEPRPGQYEGRGLWIANHLCDLVQVRTFADGSVVRLHMRRSR